MYASPRTPHSSTNTNKSKSKRSIAAWDDSIEGVNATSKYSSINKPASTSKLPYSQMIINENPDLFESQLSAQNNEPSNMSDSDDNFNSNEEEIEEHKPTKSRLSKKELSDLILEKARRSELLSSFHENSEISTNLISKSKKQTKPSKKIPSLYSRSIKKISDSNSDVTVMYDRYDLAKLRQDNIDYRNQIAKLKAAIDKANLENQKLRQELAESEKISSKQKAQIQFLLNNNNR
ncbi:hypothetical protein TVAG_078150 [Trichomonas vaginalis G3]|uniref:Uncharacterized protein n=1 Tax=Trichomonas vaginalis (strain ATCC PRA-98 / G3) TaxID=412133 RepID=A2FIB8_TRIV3|nr:hypothetical protein TVAGG3_0558340 [Trichomonas vaginalis G3]EAX95359.1 hypothetical protein TVAG_078150 [Trichomonas vaginalis G3]KAI5521004.1 hypothetical protein TVAGG3_0558340 [Trichomonas vaginalis G3]|eukprot:XP_001308289.1 hypothetical protein [Trichomonas vaginalis G3]